MFESLSYIAKTISQEIEDQFTIIKEIIEYYREEFREKIKTKEQMIQIKAAMAKANSYQ
jgi:DNA-binding GntR family transcriptional regulator